MATLRDTEYEVVDYFYTNSTERPNRGWKADMLKFPQKLLFSIDQDLAVRVLGGFSLMVLVSSLSDFLDNKVADNSRITITRMV